MTVPLYVSDVGVVRFDFAYTDGNFQQCAALPAGRVAYRQDASCQFAR
jgi:hypothetical protein